MAADNVTKEILTNGITVIVQENHYSHVAACNFWVKVGSAYETDTEKGMTHFIEHLMFKGTKKRGVGQIDKEITELGGYNNAFTSFDATNYVIVLPSDQINKAIEIEHDALTASVFDAGEVDKEREVVISELNRGLDNPPTFIWQKLMLQTFDAYYMDPIIGYEEKLRKYDRAKIVDFYTRHYTPENLVIVVSGDVDTKKVLPYLETTFGGMEKKGVPVAITPPALADRPDFIYNTFPGDIESRNLAIAFRIPDGLSGDIPKIEILARLLGGSESSVLYRVLKEEKQLVDDIDVDMFTGKAGGLIGIFATVREGKYEETIKTIYEELARLKLEPVKPEALSRVKSDVIREQDKENMKVENMAMNLGFYEVLGGDYRLYDKYNDSLRRVIETDIPEMAAKYMNPQNSSIVFYYPKKAEKEFTKYKDKESIRKLLQVGPKPVPEEAGKITETELKNGIMLIHKKLDNTSIVSVKAMFRGGVVFEGAEEGAYRGITNLMMETMMKGTKKRDAIQINEQIDDLGGILGKDIEKDDFGWGIEVLNTNFDPMMEILSDIILNPTFDAKETAKEKEDIINMINRRKDNPASYAVKLFNETLFEWHPYGFSTSGEVDTVKRFTPKKLKDWHDKYLMPNELVVTVIGNIGLEDAKNIVGKYFGNWKKGKAQEMRLPVKITVTKKEKREPYEKNQCHIVLGFLGPKTNTPDFYPFRVLDSILSGSMNSLLFTEIRDKRNLCYTIYSTFDRNVERGAFRIYTATSPDKRDEAIKEILVVLKGLYDNGVTDEQVATAKTYINGMYKIGMQDYMGQADSYSSYEITGLGYAKVDTFLDSIMKVSKADVDAMIKKYFVLDDYTLVIVGGEPKNDKNQETK